MNKKVAILIGVAVLVLALAAVLIFGMDWEYSVGICYKTDTDADNQVFREALEKALADREIRVITCSAQGDPALQTQQVCQLAEQDCDVLLVEPVAAVAPKELTDLLVTLELPAVVTGAQADGTQSHESITYLGADPAQAGTVQAQMALALPDGSDINGDGVISYVVIQGPEDHMDARLRTGALEYALSAGDLRGNRLALKQGAWTEESGKQLCLEAMAEFGVDIEVIFCGSDLLTQGAAAAVAESGWTAGEDFYLFGMGTQAETRQLLEDGVVSGTVDFNRTAYVQYLDLLIFNKLTDQQLPQQPNLLCTAVLP